MIEQPWEKDNGAIDDPDGVRVPGPEDDPMTAPRDEPVPDDGGSLDVPAGVHDGEPRRAGE